MKASKGIVMRQPSTRPFPKRSRFQDPPIRVKDIRLADDTKEAMWPARMLTMKTLRCAAACLALACVVTRGNASAAECVPTNAVHVAIAKQIGDTYNQIATDGDDAPGSYFAQANVRTGAFAFSVQSQYSQYDSQHAGAGTLTVVHTIAGPTVSVPWFVATDRTSEAHVAACTRRLGVYAGVGYLQTQSNYAYPYGYGPLRGLGAGLERFADPHRRLDGFGSLYYYPAAAGTYGSRRVTYAIVSFDGGFRWRLGRSGVGLIAGLYEEMRTLRPGSRAGFMIRDGPYLGFDF